MTTQHTRSLLQTLERAWDLYNFYKQIATYRYPGKSILFVRNNKCASTFYSNIFMANGWQVDNFENINWAEDKVFSVIIDPYVRHVKGLVQDLCDRGIERIALNNFGRTFWHSLPWIGHHSMPISIKFDNHHNQIDWIPADADRPTEDIITNKLKKYDIDINWGVPVYRNESDEYKKQLFHDISAMSNCQEKQTLLTADYQIYQQALDTYN